MQIDISLTETASSVLHAHGISSETYGPAYGGESAGLDLYNAGPEVVFNGRNKWTAFDQPITLVSTGVRINLPENAVGLIKERGSILEYGLVIRAGVIDPGYTGEIFVSFVNVGEKDVTIPTGAKLPVQLLVLPCYTNYNVVTNLEYLEKTDAAQRKGGSLGSSDAGDVEN